MTAWESGWARRWLVVLAGGVIMGAALGIRHVHGLFLQPVTLDTVFFISRTMAWFS